MSGRIKLKKVFHLLGILFFWFSIVYLYKLFIEYDFLKSIDNIIENWQSNYSLITIVISLYITVMFLGAFVWSSWLIRLDDKNNYVNQRLMPLFATYFSANILKYLPGNIFQFLGRNGLGARLGFGHNTLALSSFAEIIMSLTAGALILIILIPFYTQSIDTLYILDKVNVKLYLAIGVSFFVLLTLAYIYFADSLKLKLKAILGNNIKFFAAKNIGLMVFTFLLLGMINVLLFYQLFDVSIDFKFYFVITFGFTLSWLFGFILPGSPGGIGVREVFFIGLLSGTVSGEQLLTVSVIFRSLSLIIELMFFVIFVVIYSRLQKKSKTLSN